jgi:hypothetical protein
METRLHTLVDVMRVPLVGDPRSALVRVGERDVITDIECDVLVVGGGTGGVAAALAAARRGCSVCVIEETDYWIGGQLTSQGVAALDEHPLIETFGGTASYYRLRYALRDHYRTMAAQAGLASDFNPGGSWVTKLAFEPAVAVEYLRGAMERAGRVGTYLRTKTSVVTVENDSITSVLAVSLIGPDAWRFHPKIVLDATELGDLLSLSGAEYRVGAQTEAPADLQRIGAPEVKLRSDVMSSADGLSKHPYIRESRRLRAVKTIVEQEVSAEHQRDPFPRFGGHRLVSDRHSSGCRRRRGQLSNSPLPDPAWSTVANSIKQSDCGIQEHRNYTHH